MTPDLPENLGKNFSKMDGIEIKLNEALCVGCGKCINDICFVEAISFENGKAIIDLIKCRCCGRCAEICSSGALTVQMEEDAVKHSIKRVESLVDVESE
jgi:ferredoxin